MSLEPPTSELVVHDLRRTVVAEGTHVGKLGHERAPVSRGTGELGHRPIAVVAWNKHAQNTWTVIKHSLVEITRDITLL